MCLGSDPRPGAALRGRGTETGRCAAGPEPETEPRVLGLSGRDQALPGGSAAPAPSAALLGLEPGSCPRGHPEPGCGAQGHTEGRSPRPGAAAPGSVRYLRGPSPRRYTPRVGPRGPRRLLVREVTPAAGRGRRRLLVTRPQQPGPGQRRPGSRRGLLHRAPARRNRDRARQPRTLAGFKHFSFSRASGYSFLLCAAPRGGGRCPPAPRLPRSRFSSTPRKLPVLLHLSGRGSCHSSSGIPAEAAGGSDKGGPSRDTPSLLGETLPSCLSSAGAQETPARARLEARCPQLLLCPLQEATLQPRTP